MSWDVINFHSCGAVSNMIEYDESTPVFDCWEGGRTPATTSSHLYGKKRDRLAQSPSVSLDPSTSDEDLKRRFCSGWFHGVGARGRYITWLWI